MTPTSTITFVAGIITCCLGVCTFVMGLITRAKADGVLSEKVDNALEGIKEIQENLKNQQSWREEIGIEIGKQQKEIESIKEDILDLKKTVSKIVIPVGK